MQGGGAGSVFQASGTQTRSRLEVKEFIFDRLFVIECWLFDIKKKRFFEGAEY
jgi:hypothetical protein